MDLEASPRQLIDRGAAAPVERQEASRFSGGRASDLVTFYEDRPPAPSACEVSNRGADRATAADHDTLVRAHTVVPTANLIQLGDVGLPPVQSNLVAAPKFFRKLRCRFA